MVDPTPATATPAISMVRAGIGSRSDLELQLTFLRLAYEQVTNDSER